VLLSEIFLWPPPPRPLFHKRVFPFRYSRSFLYLFCVVSFLLLSEPICCGMFFVHEHSFSALSIKCRTKWSPFHLWCRMIFPVFFAGGRIVLLLRSLSFLRYPVKFFPCLKAPPLPWETPFFFQCGTRPLFFGVIAIGPSPFDRYVPTTGFCLAGTLGGSLPHPPPSPAHWGPG